ncbi:alpha/beta fold hydrolase [Trinickia sp.]|uniref:alpha/beta fold hydrolase n=1 Tax=Trinickia sp. TaxID=2571163 RepID=UPI003F7DA30A
MSAWILLRGLTRESGHWSHLREHLRAAGIEGDIVFADLPGSGRHVLDRAPLEMGPTTDFVRARLSAAGHAPPYRLIALSLGAMVAVDWAQRFPEEIEALVLINTSMRRYSGPFERLRPGAWPAIVRIARHWGTRSIEGSASVERRNVETMIHALTCARTDTRDTDVSAWTEIFERAPPARANALRQLCAAARFRGAPLAPHCPTLLLASRADALVHPACSAKLAAAWGAAIREHPWAGHDLAHDDPVWLAETIAAWVGNALAVAAPPTSA